MGICKTCGKNSDSDYCFQHKPRTQLQQRGVKPTLSSKKGLSVGKSTQKSSLSCKKLDKSEDRIRKISEMREFFLHIWKKRAHYSEITGQYLGKEPMSTYFHHILPKEKYPEACLDEENIILLTLEEHSNVENDMYRYEEINNRRNLLKLKYEH
jgi:hypothetical protein